MSTWIPEKTVKKTLAGWHITDGAVLCAQVIYLVARQTIRAKIQPSHWQDHDILARLIRIDLSKAPGQTISWQDFDGFKNARCGVAQKPEPMGVLLADNFAGDSWPWGESINGPVQPVNPPTGCPSANRLRCIEGHLYLAGRWDIYKRSTDNQWLKLSNDLHTAGKDATEYCFADIDGFAENDIYSIAYRAKQAEIWHFDGNRWEKTSTPTFAVKNKRNKSELTALCCAADGFIYISEKHGNLWRGRGADWELLYNADSHKDQFGNFQIDWKSMLWFEGKLWCASDSDLFIFDGERYQEVTQDDKPLLYAYKTLKLDARDGLLILANDAKVIFRQHGKWQTLLAIPEKKKKASNEPKGFSPCHN